MCEIDHHPAPQHFAGALRTEQVSSGSRPSDFARLLHVRCSTDRVLNRDHEKFCVGNQSSAMSALNPFASVGTIIDRDARCQKWTLDGSRLPCPIIAQVL
jgi:hypothetical protein